MTPGDTLPPAHCVSDLFGSLGLPNLETGRCVCYTQGGGGPHCVISFFPHRHVGPCPLRLGFFSSLGFPDLETGSCRGGAANCVIMFFSRLSGFGKPLPTVSSIFFVPSAYRIWKQGGVSVITGGAIQSTSSSIFSPNSTVSSTFFPQANCVIDLPPPLPTHPPPPDPSNPPFP